jgi:hypothetical protein
MARIKTIGRINAHGIGYINPEDLRAKFVQDPYKWFRMLGAKKYYYNVVARVNEILDMGKWFGIDVDELGNYIIRNTLKTDGIFKVRTKIIRRYPLGLWLVKIDDDIVNNLAFHAVDNLIYEKPKKRSKIKTKARSFSKYIY